MIVVLFSPQIPQNTGNVVRTCAVAGCSLILVKPLGFSLQDRWLKRAGLDYWEGVDVQVVDSLEPLLERAQGRFHLFTSKGQKTHYEASYSPNDLLIFGSETSGLPPSILSAYPSHCVKIPMQEGSRCLNLATSVGIGVYEAKRDH